LLDHIAYTLSFAFAYITVVSIRNRLSRWGVLTALLVINSLSFWGYLLYVRFFHARPAVGLLWLWSDVPFILDSIISLIIWPDLLVFLAVPAALAMGAGAFSHRPTLSRRLLILPLLAALAIGAHWNNSPPGWASISQVNPAIDLSRQLTTFILDSPVIAASGKNVAYSDKNIRAFFSEHFPPEDFYPYSERPGFPLAKRLKDKPEPLFDLPERPNVVLVVLESARAAETHTWGGRTPSLTPNLDRLAGSGLAFMNHYESATLTVRNELSILCSFLPREWSKPVYKSRPGLRLMCLPEALGNQGYETLWFSTWHADFNNGRAFLGQHGIERFYDKVPERLVQAPGFWKSPQDEHLYEYAAEVLSNTPEPFFAEILTTSNHDPFKEGQYPTRAETPVTVREEDRFYNSYQHGLYYSDHALGRFMEQARKKPFFSNTVFIITGDHGQFFGGDGDWAQSIERRMRIPLVLYSPEHIHAGRIEMPSTHMDITPTVLDLLGFYPDNAFLGRSLLRPSSPRPVFSSNGNRWYVRDGESYCYWSMHDVPADLLSGGSACFRSKDDLLRDGASKRLTPLPPEQRKALLESGEMLICLVDHLISRDSVFPEETRMLP
jgi:arylsulfatase A-like enzyme